MDSNQDKDKIARSFSFISIGDEEADEVIQAGAVEQHQQEEPVVDSVSAEEPLEAELAEEVVQEPVASSKLDRQKKADYQQTTLEDLDAEPMPFVQKAVLILAAVLIVAAVAYYFLVM